MTILLLFYLIILKILYDWDGLGRKQKENVNIICLNFIAVIRILDDVTFVATTTTGIIIIIRNVYFAIRYEIYTASILVVYKKFRHHW